MVYGPITNLEARRHQAGLTQAELGRMVKVSGKTVSAWELGRFVPTYHHRRQLAAVLGGSPAEYEDQSRRYPPPLSEVRALMGSADEVVAVSGPPRRARPRRFAVWMVKRMTRVMTSYLTNPGRPDRDALRALRAELAMLGEYRVDVDGQDPAAELRARWLEMLDRIIATT